ncbi:carbohydrate-binding protein [Massilia sp. CF038]|uniref:carbohydrate-binding protein n=1 Tax=Massilia sp. CF038 TaxID=1881045 RepID=UPI00091EC878|nr:carbohydrate-binding protein [Massilia sp. CF038]SHH71374.1 Carbohydrate binding module (family 6) [Massilia sp. CF038]
MKRRLDWLLGCAAAVLSTACAAQSALPGRLEAESFASMAGVATEASSDTGGGLDVGWIDTGDWMSYAVNPASAGWYTVQYRVASPGTSGQIVLSQNAKDISAVTAVPNTGGWQNWATVSARVYLNAGPQQLAVFAKGGGFNLNWISFAAEGTPSALPGIRQNGAFWVDTAGKKVDLRGVNLGNWLQLEFWMMNQSMSNSAGVINDQCTLESTLSSRFGQAEKERLMGAFRDSWITARDFDLIKSLGMNVVRVPFHFSLVEDETRPYTLRADAWKHLDFAINEAEKRGMYVILDLHGAVGGQAGAAEQHDGCVGAAQMWTNNSYRDRTKWLWDMVASRYRGRTAVAAYDLLNEPWGTDAGTMAAFAYELFNVVRAKDPEHVIILPGHNSGIDAYGNPNTRGLSNVALGMHFYPGLWGWNEVQGAAAQANVHANWLHCNTSGTGESCDWNSKLTALQTPFIIGEFQPWALTGAFGGQVTRKTYDIYNQYGWAGTSWAYKTVSYAGSNGDTNSWGWGVVSNSSNGGAMGSINVSTASSAQIESYFRAFASQALVRNESVAYWMNWKPAVGARIEAEMFAYHKGMRMETTSDSGGGFNVGNVDNNDWMSYPVNVPKTGWYNLQFRLASPYSGGQFALSRNSTDLVTVTVPNTGGWQNWQTATAAVYLNAGQQDLTIYSKVGGWNINWWQLSAQ